MATMTKLHKDWSVEMLGLIECVEFRKNHSHMSLFWCDGEWKFGYGQSNVKPAPGVPAARNMKEARKIGTEWINAIEAEDAA